MSIHQDYWNNLRIIMGIYLVFGGGPNFSLPKFVHIYEGAFFITRPMSHGRQAEAPEGAAQFQLF